MLNASASSHLSIVTMINNESLRCAFIYHYYYELRKGTVLCCSINDYDVCVQTVQP